MEALRAHVKTVHPRQEGGVFSICATLGAYEDPNCGCCPEELSELVREINIGPAMFLMSTKQIMKFFFLLSILNIPSYLFFY